MITKHFLCSGWVDTTFRPGWFSFPAEGSRPPRRQRGFADECLGRVHVSIPDVETLKATPSVPSPGPGTAVDFFVFRHWPVSPNSLCHFGR